MAVAGEKSVTMAVAGEKCVRVAVAGEMAALVAERALDRKTLMIPTRCFQVSCSFFVKVSSPWSLS